MKRRKGRHKLIAVNFLANISLEGRSFAKSDFIHEENGTNNELPPFYPPPPPLKVDFESHKTLHESCLIRSSSFNQPNSFQLQPRRDYQDISRSVQQKIFDTTNTHPPAGSVNQANLDKLTNGRLSDEEGIDLAKTPHSDSQKATTSTVSPPNPLAIRHGQGSVCYYNHEKSTSPPNTANIPHHRDSQHGTIRPSHPTGFPVWPNPVVGDQMVSYAHFVVTPRRRFASSTTSPPDSTKSVLTNLDDVSPRRFSSYIPSSAPVVTTTSTTEIFDNTTSRIIYPDPLDSYSPTLLDDPELKALPSSSSCNRLHQKPNQSKRTTVKLSSYLLNVLTPRRGPDERKQSVNVQFKTRFPAIQITLSKLRSIKALLAGIVQKLYLAKSNRKASSAAVLLISAKLNDVKRHDLANLIQELESSLRIGRSDILQAELAVSVVLEFCLASDDCEIEPHRRRLLSS